MQTQETVHPRYGIKQREFGAKWSSLTNRVLTFTFYVIVSMYLHVWILQEASLLAAVLSCQPPSSFLPVHLS
jgi:hypothetical protein